MNITISGNHNKSPINTKKYTIHKVLRPEYKLHIGSECNDGRPITQSWRYKQALKLGIPIVRKAPQVAALKVGVSKEMFVDKYAPKSVSDVIGHKEQIKQITEWLQSWHSGLDKRGILITGPPGIGKTTTAHLIVEACGYKVKEYNASDTRSISALKGMIALGIRRLIKEVIVMDEIDGLSDRGGVGEIAAILKKTSVPIICIANDKPPKLRPIINACLDIKFNRPVKSTIATTLLKIAKKEGIDITASTLETLCEKNGNDIRSILNNLEFYGSDIPDSSKDANLRLNLFSATQRLIGNKKLSLDEAADLVFVDYGMIPLMVQEAYIASSKHSLDDIVKASEFISTADLMDKYIHQKQDWNLLPHYVQNVASAAKSVSGPTPFQIFPQWLGKNSKRLKHRRYMDDLSSKVNCSNADFRLDYADAVYQILLAPLIDNAASNIKNAIKTMDTLRLTRDDLVDKLQEVLINPIEIPTKTKTAFTREYNKTHPDGKSTQKKIKKLSAKEELEEEALDELEELEESEESEEKEDNYIEAI
jgi:replication factor C subunit 1